MGNTHRVLGKSGTRVVSSSVAVDGEGLSGEGKEKESNGSEKVTPVCEVPCRRMIVDLGVLVPYHVKRPVSKYNKGHFLEGQ